ncbi:MAG: restriction endonuclease subunit S [Myxococcales bacterium]|nr:restriction endonuclease subunit S [Myxococcales bacterium]
MDEVAEVRLGRQRSPDRANGDNMRPYMRAANVTWDGISLDDVKEMDFSPKEFVTYELKDGDILLSEASGSASEVGKPAIWRDQVPGCCFQNTLIRVRSRGPLPEYLHLHFLADARLGRFAAVGKGSGINHLGADRLSSWPTALPPLNEQHRIVAKLEALQARSRRAREALDAVPPLLEKLRQSILAAAFRGDLTKDWRAKNKDVEPATELLKRIRAERKKKWEEAELAKMKAKGKPPTDDKWKAKYKEPEPVDTTGLPELPNGWCWASVDELTGLVTSGSRGWAEYYADTGPLFIRSQDINTDSLSLHEVAHVQVPASAEGARTRVRQFDLLITITGANVTRCAWVTEPPGEAYVSQHVALVRPAFADSTPYMHLWLVSETGGRRRLKQAAYGLGKPGLSLDDVATVQVPLAPAEEQSEIVRRAAELRRSATSTDMLLKAQLVHLGLFERSVLAKAFRGELVPQDPNDEPADVMLARLVAEKADASVHERGAKRGAAKRGARA